jgi:hypothetical protein
MVAAIQKNLKIFIGKFSICSETPAAYALNVSVRLMCYADV